MPSERKRRRTSLHFYKNFQFDELITQVLVKKFKMQNSQRGNVNYNAAGRRALRKSTCLGSCCSLVSIARKLKGIKRLYAIKTSQGSNF